MKPRVLTKCVANGYTGPDERIVEFSNGRGTGGLIRFWWDEADGILRLAIYRQDRNVVVQVADPE